ncbi:MAG: Atg14 domain-containing protein [Thermoproteaceae archaeon]|nr:Atg14 domain-containing protein [Thermoproteaceae archaeon]
MGVDLTSAIYGMLRSAAEEALQKALRGKKLSGEDVFLLYLSTLLSEAQALRAEVAKLNERLGRIDAAAAELQRQLAELRSELERRTGMLPALVSDISRLLSGLVKK